MRNIRQYKIWKRANLLKRHLQFSANPQALRKLSRVPAIEWAMRTKQPVLRSMPVMIKVEPTNICNLRCPGCYSHNTMSWTGKKLPPRPKGRMGLDTFRKIVDELGGYLYKISLYGQGEPLLNEEIFDIISYAASCHVSCVVSTNLQVMQAGMMEQLLNCGLEHLIVAVDTLDPDIYAAYRVGGSLEVVLTNLEELIKRKQERGQRFPLIEVQAIIRQNNQDEIPKLRKYTGKIGADRFSAKLDSEFLKTIPLGQRPIRPCYWLWYSSSINWDGAVSPCGCALVSRDFVYGNISQQKFKEIWNSDQYTNSRRLFARGKRPDITRTKECYTCPIFPNSFYRQEQLSVMK